jgi:hypothetical protein
MRSGNRDGKPVTIDELKLQKRWVCWRREVIKGKETKVPYQPNGYRAASNKPSTWSTYAECAAVSQLVGIVLGDGIVGVDFDRCCDAFEGKFTPGSREMVIALDSYGEYSPNGFGAHVLLVADMPGDGKPIVRPGPDFKQIEIKGSGFYFTYSARHLSKTPSDLMPRQAQLDTLCKRVLGTVQSKPGLAVSSNEEEKYARIMAGDFSDYAGDLSRADMALCGMLAHRHNNNIFKIDAAWLASPLYREKLDREDYRSMTIQKVLKGEPVFTAGDDDVIEDDSPREYLVEALPEPGTEGWFPKGEISLIGGSSGTGKTSWSIPMLEKIRKGEPVYGHPTKPRDYRVLLNDRSRKGTLATLNALRLPKEAIARCIRLTTNQQQSPPSEILAALIEQHPGAETWFIEGLDMWLPDLYDMRKVSAVLDGMQRIALRHNVAVVATVGSPKMKSKEGKYSGRDNLFGSVALGRKAETVVLFQLHDSEDVNSVVVCTVLCRCGKPEKFYLAWGVGGLQLTTKPDDKPAGRPPEKSGLLKLNIFARFKPGERIRFSPELGASKGTYYTWLERAVAEGLIDKRDDVFYIPTEG